MNTKALLRLIAEFTERGEHVTTATTSRTHAAKLLCNEPGYPRVSSPPTCSTCCAVPSGPGNWCA
ncbi:hypothetical protein H0I39_19675 [Ottowia beijingensis]|uniref:Uncharacterized protein n=1 Tax=Ottowia beijingensis TaxID=1207057 RepID=A0A853IZJ7_9BURK|nr:hypothetical protein [Ottowia beijingensis]NZA00579.1 hypothetical protein [Ottowia beijingensis]NZA03377.1 hypothetical protein [Ottowia beijingensis]